MVEQRKIGEQLTNPQHGEMRRQDKLKKWLKYPPLHDKEEYQSNKLCNRPKKGHGQNAVTTRMMCDTNGKQE